MGLCIEAGGFFTNAVFALVKPGAIGHLWQEVDLSALLKYDRGYFFTVTFTMSIAAVMKAWLFYLIIKMLQNKKLNMERPFSKEVSRFIFNISYLALVTGLFSW